MARPAHRTVVEAIYAAVPQPDLWPSTLATIADHIGASGGMIAYQDLVGTEALMTTSRLRGDLTQLYFRHYTHNAYSRGMSLRTPGHAVLGADIIDPGALRRTAFHADILAPQRIEEKVFMGHPALTSPSTSGGISFTLDRHQADERGVAAERLQHLAPHLVRALDLAIAVGRRAQAASVVLDVLPGAALLLDRGCRVLRANRCAETLLAARDGLLLDPDRGLSATGSRENLDLSLMLKAAVGTAAGEEATPGRAALTITRPAAGSVLVVTATPLPPAGFAIWEGADDGARALVRIADPDASLEGQAELLREAAGLTATEARIAALIAQGRTAPDVAAMLKVSPATVRTHLSHCFDKTGTRSQVALARLLAALAG